jgi:hypothetical protein
MVSNVQTANTLANTECSPIRFLKFTLPPLELGFPTMKFSSTLFTLVLAFASLTGLSQADPSAPPLPPAIFTPDHMENTWQWKLRAETIPGWLYSVEESQDLITWTTLPNSYFYGNGQQMSCYFCDGPPPADTAGSSGGTTTGTAGTSHLLKILFLTLRMQANGASSRFYLQREAAPAANIPGWDADLTDLLPPQPVGVRALYLMGWTDPNGTNTYWVDVQVIVEDAPPPVADPATSGEEAEELNVFQQIKSQIIARLLLPEEEAPEPTPSNSKFARIRRTAIDSNGNGYPDWYEIGNFPPGAQFAQIGSPLYVSGNVDTDNDGFTDAEEAAAGTDPNDATKHPPAVTRLVVLRRSAGENFSGNNGTYVDYINWPELKNYILWPAPARLIAAPTSFTATGSITPEQLSNHVTALRAFPGTPDPAPYLRLPMGTVTVAGSFTHKVTSLEDYSGTSPPTSYIEQSGNLEHLAVWLEHKPKETTPVTATFLAVPRQQLRIHGSPAGAMVTGIPEIVSFTIPAGQTLSNTSKELKPEFSEPPDENYNLDTQVSLIPVEIVDNNKNPISKLKVGKMSETGVLSGTGASAVLDIDKDSDRFFVRVKGGAAMGGISVKVSTTDNPETAYNDNATQIDLVTDGEDAISKSMLLVSDDVDDDHPVDAIADDATGDRTHKIQLGGNFKIEGIKIGTGGWQTMDAKTPVPVLKTVTLNVAILRDKPASEGGTLAVSSSTLIETHLKRAQERYAQTGVKLSWSVAEAATQTSVNLEDGLAPRASDGSISEEKTVISDLGTSSESDIHIFYARIFTGAPTLYGESLMNFSAPQNTANNNIFMSGTRAETGPFASIILAHELGHLLTTGGHESDTHNIMAGGNIYLFHGNISDSKRFTKAQAEQIIQNPLSK